VALMKTSTKGAPWYVVPANKKWYARYAVQQLLLNALTDMDPTWPVMDFDVATELKRLDAS
jgi:polyphosphate kinase 2 (PPK2 family)